MQNKQRVAIIRRSMAVIIVSLSLWAIIILAIYGGVQLWDRSDRILQKQVCIDTINKQQQRIIELESEKRNCEKKDTQKN